MNGWICRITLILVVLLIGVGQAATTTVNSELQQKLLEMGDRDQRVRERISPLISAAGLGSDEFKALAEEMAEADRINFAELERIIEQFGWPGIDLVGPDASNAAFLILQHAPLVQQKKLLPVFRQAVAEGRARASDLALLEDRILVREGKKQLYGSQVTAGPDGKPRLDPVEDPENLDLRRRAVGLQPLEEYLKRLEADIGQPIDRQALQ